MGRRWRAIKWRSLFGLWSFAANRQTDRDSVSRASQRMIGVIKRVTWISSSVGADYKPTNQPAAPPSCRCTWSCHISFQGRSVLKTTWRALEYSKYFLKSQSVVIKIITIALISQIPKKRLHPLEVVRVTGCGTKTCNFSRPRGTFQHLLCRVSLSQYCRKHKVAIPLMCYFL